MNECASYFRTFQTFQFCQIKNLMTTSVSQIGEVEVTKKGIFDCRIVYWQKFEFFRSIGMSTRQQPST